MCTYCYDAEDQDMRLSAMEMREHNALLGGVCLCFTWAAVICLVAIQFNVSLYNIDIEELSIFLLQFTIYNCCFVYFYTTFMQYAALIKTSDSQQAY
jgi:hypothetical protein